MMLLDCKSPLMPTAAGGGRATLAPVESKKSVLILAVTFTESQLHSANLCERWLNTDAHCGPAAVGSRMGVPRPEQDRRGPSTAPASPPRSPVLPSIPPPSPRL